MQSEDDKPTTGVGPELYNKPDFFFQSTQIPGFSVWARTTNRNKKLDLAYREAMKEEHRLIIRFFR
jgi:YTH domain-containing family protein